MEEKFVLKVKRTIKKIAALTTGAVMVGATVTGAALATMLSDLPSPFVSSGNFDADVVVGSSSTSTPAGIASDVAGAIDVAAAFAQLATTTGGAGSGSATLQVDQFSGEDMTALTIDTTTGVNHTAKAENWMVGSDGDTTPMPQLDPLYYSTHGEYVNSTVQMAADSDMIEFNPVDRTLLVNRSETGGTTKYAFRINFSTNRSQPDAGFGLGDKINWFGTGYEITVTNATHVTLGSSATTRVNVGSTVTVGGTTYTLSDISSDANYVYALLHPSSGSDVTVNNSATTKIGDSDVQVTSIFSGSTTKYADLSVVEKSYKFKQGDQWPIDTNWYIKTLTIETTSNNVTALKLYSNMSFTLSVGDQHNIADSVNFTYNDFADPATTTEDFIRILETSKVNDTFNVYEANGVMSFAATDWDDTLIPGVSYVTVSSGIKTGKTIAQLNASNGADFNYYINRSDGKYELRLLFDNSEDTWTAYRPDSDTNLTSSGADPTSGVSWSNIGTGDNHTTPSGLDVFYIDAANAGTALSAVVIEAKAINIEEALDGDFSGVDVEYFVRDGSSKVYDTTTGVEGTILYTKYGYGISWDDATDTVSVSQPDGKSLTVDFTFAATASGSVNVGDAIVTATTDVKFDGASTTAVDFYKNTTAAADSGTWDTSKDHETAYKSKIFLIDTTDTNIYFGTGEESTDVVDDQILLIMTDKQIKIGIGGKAPTTTTVAVGDNTTIGNTTITVESTTGETVSKITPGIGGYADEKDWATVATRPVILIGGPYANSVTKYLADQGLTITASEYVTGQAIVDYIAAGLNSQDVLLIAGYAATDTKLACKVVAQEVLNSMNSPITVDKWNSTKVTLNTGTATSYQDVTVVE
ncbi:MAG: hypothetical protein GOU97_00390 [Nanoarchaeota archaeon]|nr:hypothetical protein [Nanoarchaeota archaeon]